jgi:hypothetical protein
VLARHVGILFRSVARSTECGHFIGSSHAVRRRFALRRPMLHAGAMTRITTQSLRKVRMSFEIGNLFLMARDTKLMRFLAEHRQDQEQQK